MAFLQINFHSNVLGMASSLDAIVPQSQNGPLKVLWLLHGLSDDQTIWQRRAIMTAAAIPRTGNRK